MSQVAVAEPEVRKEEEIVTFWDIARKQFTKNKPAMVALWLLILTIVLAIAAPLITMNAPYVMKSSEGVSWPFFDQLFNRLVFKSPVDIFFNLLLYLGPVWWFGSRMIRASGLEGERNSGKFLRNGISLGLLLLFYIALVFMSRSIYIRLLVIGLGGLAFLAYQSSRVPNMLPRRVRKMRMQTRGVLLGLLLATFMFTLHGLHYTAPVVTYRTKIAEIEKTGGWAIKPPIFNHPDNAGEDSKVVGGRFLKPPSFKKRLILGTDNNGRDVFSRILFGTRISLTIGIIAVSIYATIGTILGSIAGYVGGRTDMFILFLVMVMICIPSLFLMLTIVAVFEDRSIFLIMLAIALVSWTGITRLVRGEFLRQRSIDYVTAARALGVPERRIIFGHILKNAMSPVLVAVAFGIAGAILAESFISFIGMGDLKAPSWGQTLKDGREQDKMWLILAPGIAIFFVVTILNMVGDGLRDALDPKLRQ